MLRWAIKTQPRYIGMIGSKFKKKSIFQNLMSEGITSEQLSSVFSPMGLDIDAILPEEIAVSIVAQMISVRRSKLGSILPVS